MHNNKFNEAKKLSEGAEQGDYDYDNKKVTDLLAKAKAADARHDAEKQAKAQKTRYFRNGSCYFSKIFTSHI